MRVSTAASWIVVLVMMLWAADAPAVAVRDGQPASPEAKALERLTRSAKRALEAADSEPPADAERRLSAVLDDPAFGKLSRRLRAELLWVASGVAADAGNLSLSRRRVQLLTKLRPDLTWGWYRLARVEAAMGNDQAAIDHIVHVLQTWPEWSVNLGRSDLQAFQFAGRDHPAAQRRWLEALFATGWNARPNSASGMRMRLVELQLADGDTEQAAQTASLILHPMDVVGLRVDRRLAALHSGPGEDLDPVRRGRRLLQDLRVRAQDAPTDLEAINELIELLLVLGDIDEALALSTDTLSRIEEGGDLAEDPTFLRPWVANHRSTALLRQGDTEAAVAQLIAASQMAESPDGGNTSQLLNLATLYLRLNRPAAALDLLDQVSNPSPYGRMVMERCRFAANLDNPEVAEEALGYLREHQDDGILQWLDALLSADRIDEAAATVVVQLADDEDRTTVLFWLQSFWNTELPADGRYRQARQQLLDRADVKAAIAAVGHIERFDVYQG
ncbi:MAG: hypothetical protein KDI51_10080 [Xanthomonadales bacterium]|nr:hypothetical protein [Xanthomonadales bacterium]